MEPASAMSQLLAAHQSSSGARNLRHSEKKAREKCPQWAKTLGAGIAIIHARLAVATMRQPGAMEARAGGSW